MSLFTRHPIALQTAYSDLKRQALEQPRVLLGTPGSLGVRQVKGRSFQYRQYYDAQGRKAAEYLGPVDSPETERRVLATRDAIDVANALVRDARLLAQQGYVRADRRTIAILAAIANRGLFRSGAVLVGSHAYGAALSELGIAGPAYTTEDVDIARPAPLSLTLPEGVDFESILAESGIALSPVLGFDRKTPPTSYKARGASRLRVDLLAPVKGNEVRVRAVRELGTHATGLPHLAFLVKDPIDSVVLGREGVVPVKVPRPEALAWHKVLVSQLRASTSEKRPKDLTQAAVLIAALSEDAPDALESGLAELPKSAMRKLKAGAEAVAALLERAGHGRAVEALPI